VVYLQVLPCDDSKIESLFKLNHWAVGGWRAGVFPYHHYHSTAHEVLGIFRGWATVQFGGDNGSSQKVEAGDAVVIPAGVAHKMIDGSDDFCCVGSYPNGQEADMCYGKPGERPATDDRISQVALPKADPVFGKEGPLLRHWNPPK